MKPSALLLFIALAACETAPAPEAAPEPGRAAAPEPFDLHGYCSEICIRTSRCGLEAAKKAAQNGGKPTTDALEAASANADQDSASCVAGCTSTPISSDHRSMATHAKRCLNEASCADLERCLALL